MTGPFKMKGSPMQRNFGIGSPLHQEKKKALTDAEIRKGDHLLSSIDEKIAQEKRYDLMQNAQNLEDDKGVTPEISRESFERNFNLNTQAASDTTGAYMHQVLQEGSPLPQKAFIAKNVIKYGKKGYNYLKDVFSTSKKTKTKNPKTTVNSQTQKTRQSGAHPQSGKATYQNHGRTNTTRPNFIDNQSQRLNNSQNYWFNQK